CTLGAGLAGYDFIEEMAARSLGAHPLRAFCDVTLPQIRFSVLAAAILAFITSLDEVVVALFIAGGSSATLTKRMFNTLRDEVDPTIADRKASCRGRVQNLVAALIVQIE